MNKIFLRVRKFYCFEISRNNHSLLNYFGGCDCQNVYDSCQIVRRLNSYDSNKCEIGYFFVIVIDVTAK